MATAAFKTPDGEAAYLAGYDAAMQSWPVPYEDLQIPGRFGVTHVVVSGPKDAPPLVLLHGYMATLVMWSPNVADFSTDHRVHAVDVMGQPNRSIPTEPIRSVADYVAWLSATLNDLGLDRVSLVGMSYGGWLALNFALAAPERVRKLALLSPAACFLPIVRQFSVRGLLMVLFPRRVLVSSFMRWLGFPDGPDALVAQQVIDLMHLGLRHVRLAPETLRVVPTVFSDDELRALGVPVLLLMGDREVIYDPAMALARARRLVPDFRGELVSGPGHDMCFSHCRRVDAHVLDFLNEGRCDI